MTEDTVRAMFHMQLDEIASEMGIPKYEAFPRWICENMLGITGEDKIEAAVEIGGKSDYGVDIFHAEDSGDATEQYVCWIQAKFSNSLNRMATREEIESLGSTLGHLRNCPNKANPLFKLKSADLARIEARNPRIRKRIIFAVTGRLNEQAANMIIDENWKERVGIKVDSNTRLEVFDIDDILSRIVSPHTPPLTLKFDGNTIIKKDETTGKDSVIGHIRAGTLVNLVKAHRDTVFLENPRETLGKAAPTHKAMCNTLSNDVKRKRFWKMNNGITATCTRLEPGESPGTYTVDNLKIVNGRQTLYTLEDYSGVDDVQLLLSVHQEVGDDERNEISESTNTQNPVRPADLVSNYPEMSEMVLQCRMDFRDFYFERQTKGFKSAKRSVRTRVTKRRVLEKSGTAKAYYAYEFDPNVANVQDKVLFSTTSYPNYYDSVFTKRKMRDLIIPHIFMTSLRELHRKWCRESDGGDAAMVRRNDIISKDIVKYYILRFIAVSMAGIVEADRERIKNVLISRFSALKASDPIQDEILNVARAAYDEFITIFDLDSNHTWPPHLLEKTTGKKIEISEDDKPTPLDIMYALGDNGENLLPRLLMTRANASRQLGDTVGKKLLALVQDKD